MIFSKYYNGAFILEENRFSDWIKFVERHPILKSALEIMSKLDSISSDARSYIVGGAVRDIIMDKDFDDIDIATNVPMDKIEELFPDQHDIGKNKDFGICIVNHGGYSFEIAQYRKDGVYSDGRRPDKVEIVSSFKDDAERRDFTINAMGIDKEGNIVDYFDGKGDIKNKILRTVGDPEKRFGEDYLRMLRAVRFASRMGFDIDVNTMKAIKSNSPKIKNIAVERIMKEIIKMAKQPGERFASAIELLMNADLLQYIFPEIFGLKDLNHNPEHHPEGGVLKHTLEALRSYKGSNPTVNMAILFHDVGKLNTWSDGDHYYKHDLEGVKLIEKIAERMKLTNDMKDAMSFCAENHMLIHNFLNLKNATIYKLMQHKYWDVLLKVAEADSRSRLHKFDQDEWDRIMKKIDSMEEKWANAQAMAEIKKIVNGHTVMKLRDLTTKNDGPKIGKIIKSTIDWIVDNGIDLDDKDSIEDYIMGVEV